MIIDTIDIPFCKPLYQVIGIKQVIIINNCSGFYKIEF